jgi:hypothetical protein
MSALRLVFVVIRNAAIRQSRSIYVIQRTCRAAAALRPKAAIGLRRRGVLLAQELRVRDRLILGKYPAKQGVAFGSLPLTNGKQQQGVEASDASDPAVFTPPMCQL